MKQTKKIFRSIFIISFISIFFLAFSYGQEIWEEDSPSYTTNWDNSSTSTQQGGDDWHAPMLPADNPAQGTTTPRSQYADQGDTQEEEEKCHDGCCGVKLNTNFPIIGNCIGTKKSAKTNPTNAFPKMIGAITKIVMSLIMVICFILVIVAGIMRAGDKPKEGKELLKKVAVAILLLGFSGVILRLINPNFFG